MPNRMNIERLSHFGPARRLLAGIALAPVLLIPITAPAANGAALSGKQVVDAVCGKCHVTGVDGAPRIGDNKAWKPRIEQGLTSLSRHALQGIRKMPPHGGNPGLSDLDIKRAITYMVNQSGGRWIEPAGTGAAYRERTGEQVVNAYCFKCHETGVNGAPRIGDLQAWAARFAQGVDIIARSAVRGHGGMPPRGGAADLTDSELRSAAIYMLLKGVAPAAAPAASASIAKPPSRDDRNHAVVDGLDVYLGVVSADAIRTKPGASVEEKQMHGGIPGGRGYYHINISLLDRETGAEIKNAKIELSVEDPLTGLQTKVLDLVTFNNAASYGNYFLMPEKIPYKITAQITRGDPPRVTKARFNFKPE